MKRKYYLVLDTETATLPFADALAQNDPKRKKTIAIAKPIIYDIGWVVMWRDGTIVKRKNYLVSETFLNETLFNTAFYKDKRGGYLEALKDRDIKLQSWQAIEQELLEDLRKVDFCAAYNAAFDFKKAIPFTQKYIKALYGLYEKWEDNQYINCKKILNGTSENKNAEYLTPKFDFCGEQFPIIDLWGLACENLINNNKYRDFCLKNNFFTNSGLYFKTSAETTFQYLTKDSKFKESHTALDDAEIEAQILAKILKKKKAEPSMKEFPFRKLGKTSDYIFDKRPKKKIVLLQSLVNYLDNENAWETVIYSNAPYWVYIFNLIALLVDDENTKPLADEVKAKINSIVDKALAKIEQKKLENPLTNKRGNGIINCS